MDVTPFGDRSQDGPLHFMAFNIPSSTLDPGDVPTDVWLEIFFFIRSPSDLLNVMLASKSFHGLAIRSLHRTVVWRKPVDVIRSLPLWNQYPGMHVKVQTLECCVTTPPLDLPPIELLDIDPVAITPSEERRHAYHLSPAAHENMIARINTFANLSTLAFSNLTIHDRHLQLIYNLRFLGTLRIEACGVAVDGYLGDLNPLSLPVTDLSLRNLDRVSFGDINADGLPEEIARAVLELTRAPNLHTLRIDASADVFKYVFGLGITAMPMALGAWLAGQLTPPPRPAPPPHLERLYIERRAPIPRMRPSLFRPPQGHHGQHGHHWHQHPHMFHWHPAPPNAPGVLHFQPGVPGPLAPHVHHHHPPHYAHVPAPHGHGGDGFPDALLSAFLQRCPTLTTFSTFYSTAQTAALPPDALPLLREYCGPVDTLAGVVGGGRPIKALRLTHCTAQGSAVVAAEQVGTAPGGTYANLAAQREGIPALAAVADSLRDLEELDLEFTVWDDEIMHAVVRFFSQLRTLKITYDVGGPSETSLVAMGPELLARLPHLRTLHLYTRTGLATAVRTVDYDSDDEVERGLRNPLCLFDDTFDTLEDELRELVIPWNRYCSALREVRLTAEFRLLRGYEGGKWYLQRVGKGELTCASEDA